tara:strand:+ start:866 stop:1198 length:333 start_codon:yes stop_codon:yes gene_type:complete
MKLTKKSQKTLQDLINKSNDNGCDRKHRMPTLKSISNLLLELNINHSLDGITRNTQRGGLTSPICTTQGKKNGSILKIDNIKLDTTSIGWGHLWGTQQDGCEKILKIINN